MLDYLKNKTLYRNKYQTHSEAVVVSSYFNPHKSPYRTKAFNIFYNSIKHLNHNIIEGVIGDAEPELPETDNIDHVHTQNLLWHKEALLNKSIRELPEKYKYVFWVDADVMFKNKNWLVEGVEQLKSNTIIQPFEYCIHLDKDEHKPSFSTEYLQGSLKPNKDNKNVWRSFAANYATSDLWEDPNYNNHGHVGFAWGARRDVLEAMPLYDKALVGGADHIMAHAAVGQIGHTCITKSFTDDIESVNEWSRRFFAVTEGKMGYVPGELHHIWHGDIEKRNYFNRIKEFTPLAKTITERDDNGLYVTDRKNESYVEAYFLMREVLSDDAFTGSQMNQDNTTILSDDIVTSSKENFEGFGGGDFGGAGAGEGYDMPADPQQSNNDQNNSPSPPEFIPFS